MLLYEPNAVLVIRSRSHFFYQCDDKTLSCLKYIQTQIEFQFHIIDWHVWIQQSSHWGPKTEKQLVDVQFRRLSYEKTFEGKLDVFRFSKNSWYFFTRIKTWIGNIWLGRIVWHLSTSKLELLQPIAMKEITVAMQNKTKVDIRMSSNPLLEVLRTQFLLNCNTFIFRTIKLWSG